MSMALQLHGRCLHKRHEDSGLTCDIDGVGDTARVATRTSVLTALLEVACPVRARLRGPLSSFDSSPSPAPAADHTFTMPSQLPLQNCATIAKDEDSTAGVRASPLQTHTQHTHRAPRTCVPPGANATLSTPPACPMHVAFCANAPSDSVHSFTTPSFAPTRTDSTKRVAVALTSRERSRALTAPARSLPHPAARRAA